MSQEIQESANKADRNHTTSKFSAVVFGGGHGIFAALMPKFQEEFEVLASIQLEMPRILQLLFLPIAFSWRRSTWYRQWHYLLERTPFAFNKLTRIADSRLRDLAGRFDLILFGGAEFSPGLRVDVPLFVFSDFCRRLSSANPHDDSSRFRSGNEERAWLEREGDVYRAATRIFVGSEFVKRSLVEDYGVSNEKVVVSGFGAGVGFGQPYVKTFDGQTILYIGKGDFEKKGGVILLDAFQLVRREIPDAVLRIVGQERLPKMPGVINEGFINEREQLVSLMRSAHVFTLPSLVDRNPITVLEAMACSTPCVTSDYAAIPEILGDAGLAVTSGDPEALASALIRILRDSRLAERLGSAGRRRFEERYNWDSAWQIIRREIGISMNNWQNQK